MELAKPGQDLERHHSAPLGAPLGPRPLKDLAVPVRGSLLAHHFVPGAAVGPRPLEDLEVPTP